MFWTSDAWSTSHSSQQHSEPLLTIEYIFDIYIVESYNFGPNIFWPSDPKIAAKYYVKSSWKWILLQQRSQLLEILYITATVEPLLELLRKFYTFRDSCLRIYIFATFSAWINIGA